MSAESSTGDGGAAQSDTTTETSLLDTEIFERDTEGGLPDDHQTPFDVAAGVDVSTLEISAETVIETVQRPWEAAHSRIKEEESIPSWTGSVNVDLLDLVIRHISNSIRESKLLIAEDGFYVSVTDPANVQMFELWLDKGDFDNYNVDFEGIIGLKWSSDLKTMIQQVKSGTVVDMAIKLDEPGTTSEHLHFDFGDEFQIPDGVNMSTLDLSVRNIKQKIATSGRLKITVDDGFVMRTKTIDPDSMRDVPDLPSVKHQSQLSFPGVDLKNYLNRADDFGDYIDIRAPADEEDVVVFNTEGDITEVSKTYESVEDLVEYSGKKSAKDLEFSVSTNPGDESKFSIDHVAKFVNGNRKTDLRAPYHIGFGREVPIKVRRELGDESFISCMVAPRVTND